MTARLKSRFTEMFGAKNPIGQGGMQWAGRAEFVPEVAEADALVQGIIDDITIDGETE